MSRLRSLFQMESFSRLESALDKQYILATRNILKYIVWPELSTQSSTRSFTRTTLSIGEILFEYSHICARIQNLIFPYLWTSIWLPRGLSARTSRQAHFIRRGFLVISAGATLGGTTERCEFRTSEYKIRVQNARSSLTRVDDAILRGFCTVGCFGTTVYTQPFSDSANTFEVLYLTGVFARARVFRIVAICFTSILSWF